MSAIQAVSAAYYTSMAHNAQYALLMNNMARMGLLRNCGNMSFAALAEADKRLELQQLQESLRYRIASTMLENQKSDKHKLNTYA